MQASTEKISIRKEIKSTRFGPQRFLIYEQTSLSTYLHKWSEYGLWGR